MAVADYFLKIDGIPGESQDSKHKDEIEIMSWSWGATNAGTSGYGGGSGAGKVQVHDFNFVMKINNASPKLAQACHNGAHIKNAVLTCRKAGKDAHEFLVIKFHDLLISSFQTGGHAGSDVVPTDQISFNFSKIETEYKAQKADGTGAGAMKFSHDLKQNVTA